MFEVVNIRIDERLIHGQVAAFWTNTLRATRIMVVDDGAARDDIQKMALRMACPAGTKLSILNVERSVEQLNTDKYAGDRIFMVLKGPEVLVRMWDLGYRFETVNVGNMSSGIGTRQVKRSVNVTEEDIANFELLFERGVRFTAQMVPNEENIDFMPAIRKK